MTRSLAIAEKQPITRRCLQHADHGYSRRAWNFGGSLVRNMALIYSPDGTNAYGSRNGEFVWVESGTIVLL